MAPWKDAKMKYRFEVFYCPAILQRVCGLMKQLDIGMDGMCLHHILTFSSQKNPSISDIKSVIVHAYEADGCQVLKIEGGSIE